MYFITGYIYCIKNTINDKIYVGKTLTSVEDRWNKGHLKDYMRRRNEKRPLYDAMCKHGADKFYVELLEEVDSSNIDEREIYWIDKLNAYYNGYNATLGGDGKSIYIGDDFVEDFYDGMLINEIADKYGCSRDTIKRYLDAAGIDTRDNSTTKRSFGVHQYSKDGHYLQSFSSRSEAARYLIEEERVDGAEKMLVTHIGAAANGKRKTAAGYMWKNAY